MTWVWEERNLWTKQLWIKALQEYMQTTHRYVTVKKWDQEEMIISQYRCCDQNNVLEHCGDHRCQTGNQFTIGGICTYEISLVLGLGAGQKNVGLSLRIPSNWTTKGYHNELCDRPSV